MKNLLRASFLLSLSALALIGACRNADPGGEPDPNVPAAAFHFWIDPGSGTVTVIEPAGGLEHPLLTPPGTTRDLEDGADLALAGFSFAFLPGSVLEIDLSFTNVTADYTIGQPLTFDATVDDGAGSEEPVVSDADLGGDGILDAGETSSELTFVVQHLGTPLNYVVFANAAVGVDTSSLREAVTLASVREHQQALQGFADANGGNRAAGSPGYDASADYVADTLVAAGYDVTVQEFDYVAFRQLGPSTLEQLAPLATTYTEELDYRMVVHSEAGDVSGMVTAVDLVLGLGNASTSGCEASDFAGFPVGNIALIQRGACRFQIKAENAAAAGAAGAIIFNQGDTPDRLGLITHSLKEDYSGGIPVLFATYGRGEEWAGTSGLQIRMVADVFRGAVASSNVIAESQTGDPDNVVMVGAHLDSVPQGPGIQDNGSGSAVVLEIAVQLAAENGVNSGPGIANRVRFAWWGANETGLAGSDFHVFGLTDEERAKIALYLNFDAVGSPNFVRFVYDGDGSTFGLAGPPGSDAIESLFEGYFAAQGFVTEPTEIGFRSDYAAFFDSSIPFGGLFTGAEGIKSPAQAAVYGGTAGDPYDPCHHLACDTFDNVSLTALDQMSDAAAHAVLTFGRTP